MAAASTDRFVKVGNPGTATTLAAPGHTIAGTTFTVVSTSNWPTDTGVIFAVDTYDTSTGARVPGSYTEWEGVVASATSITGAVLRYGTDQNYSAGSTTRVYIPVASSQVNRLIDGILIEHDQDGTHGNITGGTATFSGTVTAPNFIQSGGAGAAGWTVGLANPNTVTALGNRSYSMVFNSTDLTGTLSAGMRLRTQRTVAAPTQCTSLNGTTQYYSKSSPAGMTFTDDFVVSAWVKLTSYAGYKIIASRTNGTSGWELGINSSGQVVLSGYNAGAGNVSNVSSYQSVPLNKWVHVATQLDMSAFTATTTTSYVMIDGVDVPAIVARIGTNPTALIQAGDFQIGASNGASSFFPGKIAQVAVYNAKVTQATILAAMHQTINPAATSLISGYDFNNSINDLNTTNANNLTANGSAVATNADSPFGGQADGTISSTLDYAIIQKVAFSTNTTVTVQVPEGCTIPTSGGVSAVSYSTQKAPYAFPADASKWRITSIHRTGDATSSNATYQPFLAGGWALNTPIGAWKVGWQGDSYNTTTTTIYWAFSPTSLTGVASTVTAANTTSLTARSVSPTAAATIWKLYVSDFFSLSTAQTFVMYTIGSTSAAGMDGTSVYNEAFAENTYL